MKNSVDLGGCYLPRLSADLAGWYPPRPSAPVDNTLLDLQNSPYPTQPHSIIAKYHMPPYRGGALTKLVYKKCCPSKTMSLNLLLLLFIYFFFFTRAFGEQTDSVVQLIYLKIKNKWLYGQIDLNLYDFASFLTRGRTRLSNSFNLKPLFPKPLHFKRSFSSIDWRAFCEHLTLNARALDHL